MEIRKIPIEKLNPAAYNPRKDLQPGDPEYEKLKRSIQEFGYVEPIVWNKRTGNIVGGHQRYKVLLDMGMREVDCVVVDLDETKEKALNLALNKIQGDWDYIKLKDLLQDLDTGEFDLELTGFDMGEIEDLMTQFHVPGEIVEDEAPEPPEEPVTKPGDLWILGRHRLLCGDATKAEDVERLMDGKKADMVFTDPPYNISYQGVKDKRGIINDKMSDDDFVGFLQQSIMVCDTVYVCCSWQYDHLFKQAMTNLGIPPKAMIIWNKVNPAQHLDKYFKQHEIIFYYGKFGGEKTLRGDIWECKRQRNTVHPTMKPIKLIAMALDDNPDKKIIYDGFGGSGSTLIACEQLNRICYMMEIDPVYCDVIVQRYINLKGHDGDVYLERDGNKIAFSNVT